MAIVIFCLCSSSKFLKRGLGIVPCKVAISFGSKKREKAGALVHIYRDGTVYLSHGGVEKGQGLHTKMIQVPIYQLHS